MRPLPVPRGTLGSSWAVRRGTPGGSWAVRGRFVGGPLAVRGRFVGGSFRDPQRTQMRPLAVRRGTLGSSWAVRRGTPGGSWAVRGRFVGGPWAVRGRADPRRTQMRPLAVRRGTPMEKVATAHACNRSSRRIAQLPDVRTRHGCSMHPPSRQQLRSQDAIQASRAHRGSMVFCIRNSNKSVETPRARTVVRRDGITHASPSWETERALGNKP